MNEETQTAALRRTKHAAGHGAVICATLAAFALVLLILGLCGGCAALQPGADPIVVNAERTITMATNTFDLVVAEDDSSRTFWQSNAPAFHQFAEWLRSPMTVDGITLPRGLAIAQQLEDVKLAYKAGRATSNDVATALSTLQAALNQSTAWLTIKTNQGVTGL